MQWNSTCNTSQRETEEQQSQREDAKGKGRGKSEREISQTMNNLPRCCKHPLQQGFPTRGGASAVQKGCSSTSLITTLTACSNDLLRHRSNNIYSPYISTFCHFKNKCHNYKITIPIILSTYSGQGFQIILYRFCWKKRRKIKYCDNIEQISKL